MDAKEFFAFLVSLIVSLGIIVTIVALGIVFPDPQSPNHPNSIFHIFIVLCCCFDAAHEQHPSHHLTLTPTLSFQVGSASGSSSCVDSA